MESFKDTHSVILDDQEICRVCRCESTQGNPLYHPCKCSGSIRFIHQNCLLEWLSHSKKKYCELCEHPFVFSPIYRNDMPSHIPLHMLFGQCLTRCGSAIRIGFRMLVASIVWLVLVPYVTLWNWRFYFWASESIVSSNASTPPLDYHFRLVDCLEGQVITFLIIVVVVLAYLFREWVVQNIPVEQEPEINQENGDDDDDMIKRYSKQQETASVEYDNRLAYDKEDEAQIESMMQSIMVQDPANALKRYSWQDLLNSSPVDQRSSIITTTLEDIDSRGKCDLTTTTCTDLYKPVENRLPTSLPSSQEAGSDHHRHTELDEPPPELFDINDGNFQDGGDMFDLGDDIDGLLEIIGIRGNPWLLLQNSILACLLLSLILSLVIWLPYTIGCLVILTRPLDHLLNVLRYVTDPALDYILDHWTIQPNNNTTFLMKRQGVSDIKYCLKLLWNTTYVCMDRLGQRWYRLALGKSMLDRALCIVVGYLAISTVATCLGPMKNQQQRRVHEFMRQHVLFVKVFVFVSLELVFLPIVCGLLLNLATLPLIEHATISSRWAFVMAHPYCGCFLHWFVGTGFMFHFAMFVTLSREIVRPGVMWFIRDPNDPQFHPVQEIMERPLLLLLRKLCTGVLIYLALIVVGMGTVIWTVSHYTSISHIRWAVDEPLSTLAVDILAAQFLIPPLVAYIKPRDFAKRILVLWWRAVSCRLRLSSFMFGGRYHQEELGGSWKLWSFCDLLSGEDTRMDGQLVRVPKLDSVMLPTSQRMIVPVDPVTLEPIDLAEEYMDHPASRNENGSQEDTTTIVYIPPYFGIRVGVFLFLMWFSGSVTTCSVTVAPLLLGRFIFETYLTPGKQVHDLYAFVLGAYTMVLLSVSFNWIGQDWEEYLKQGEWRMLIEKAKKSLWKKTLTGLKVIYLTVVIGWMIPLLVGVAVDCYVLMPIRSNNPHQLDLYLSQDWSFGVLYLGIIYGILPTCRQSISNGLLDPMALTRAVLAPWIFGTVCAILLPGVMAWAFITILDVQDVSVKVMIFRCIYPALFCLTVLLGLVLLVVKLAKFWIQSVRDDTFLVGKQLHNLVPPE